MAEEAASNSPRVIEVIDLDTYESAGSSEISHTSIKPEPQEVQAGAQDSASETAAEDASSSDDPRGPPAPTDLQTELDDMVSDAIVAANAEEHYQNEVITRASADNEAESASMESGTEDALTRPPAAVSGADTQDSSSQGKPKLDVMELLKDSDPAERARQANDKDRIAQAMLKLRADMRNELPIGQTAPNGSIDEGATDPVTQGLNNRIDNDNDESWMADINSIIDRDDHEKAAGKFKKARALYEAKKRKGLTNMADDIAFMRLEQEDHQRLQAREKGRVQVDDEASALPADDDEEDSLFIPEGPPLSSQKRAACDSDEDPGDYAAAEPSKQPKSNKRARAKRDDLNAAEVREARVRGAGTESSKKQGRGRPRKGEEKRRKSSKKNDKDRVTKSKSKKGRKKKAGPTFANINSLWSSDIIRDAQANAGQAAIPGYSATRKDKALRQLIASIPNAQRGAMTSDKDAILAATRKFSTSRAIKSDGKGGWLLKGMKSSLFHHQLLGAGWMRDRENASDKPLGGIVADEMGFGKTIQMIANIVDDRDAARASSNRTTLIVVTPALVGQWIDEFMKHCEGQGLSRIVKYIPGNKIESTDILGDLRGYDCVITTYNEVMRSYPPSDAPPSLTTEKSLNEWWKLHFTQNAGPLHKIRFRRIVLDECQAIKNPNGKISRAVRALTGEYRWCISGTPIQNRSEELYAYFDFLKAPHTGTFELFRRNYCDGRTDNRTPINTERLAIMLQTIMLRRTHAEKLFSRPIVSLPGIDHETHTLEFNAVERAIYRYVKVHFVERINTLAKNNELQSHYRNILAMMHRLRMCTSHVLLIQGVLRTLLHPEDVEALWRLTADEADAPVGSRSNTQMITELRRLITARKVAKTKTGKDKPTEDDVRTALRQVNEEAADVATGGRFALTFQFRKFLRALRANEAWAELHQRSLCHKCKCPPELPMVTTCLHIYCKECLEVMAVEAAGKGKDRSNCLECGEEYANTSPCEGLNELGWNTQIRPKSKPKKGKKTSKRSSRIIRDSSTPESGEGSDSDQDVDWITMSADLLPSAKTTAAKAQILQWLETSPDEKIVIFTQWMDMIRILERMCKIEKWGCVAYSGKLDLQVRARNIKEFSNNPDCKIMLCSLKAGGVGLNLTSASKVLILDLYWNSSVERQAFCRCFRIGQQKKVEIIRYVIRDTIDEDLLTMQENKNKEINAVMGDETAHEPASLDQLLELFGPIQDDEERQGFIYVEDESEGSGESDVETRIPLRPRAVADGKAKW